LIALRWLLIPCSWLYGSVVRLRNRFYDKGVFRVKGFTVPVISVGNLTAGGTGKTPFVEYLVRYCQSERKKVAVLSRGYMRSTKGTVVVSDGHSIISTPDRAGDEPFQIARRFPAAVVISDERRTRSAAIALDQFHADVIVLDDGFQHRAIKRDLDIVLMNDEQPIARTHMLPAGNRREPLSSLHRADLVVTMGVPGRSGDTRAAGTPGPAKGVKLRFRPASLRRVFGEESLDPGTLKGRPVVAFCGIANPVSFRRTLGEMGTDLRAELSFPDHHWFGLRDLVRIRKVFEGSGATMILTTEKDAVRLSALPAEESFRSLPLYFVRIEAEVVEGEGELHRLINSVIRRDYGTK
jgi:tetraacyldisaccharide 4'-kinase